MFFDKSLIKWRGFQLLLKPKKGKDTTLILPRAPLFVFGRKRKGKGKGRRRSEERKVEINKQRVTGKRDHLLRFQWPKIKVPTYTIVRPKESWVISIVKLITIVKYITKIKDKLQSCFKMVICFESIFYFLAKLKLHMNTLQPGIVNLSGLDFVSRPQLFISFRFERVDSQYTWWKLYPKIRKWKDVGFSLKTTWNYSSTCQKLN